LNNDNIINLSSRILSPSETNLLNLGLSFCPTNKPPDKTEILTDYYEFDRKLRLNHFFTRIENQINPSQASTSQTQQPQQSTNNTSTTKKKKPGWTPPPGQNPYLDIYLSLTQTELLQYKPTPNRKHNLTPRLRKALNTLRNDNTIIIKPADKGGATVIINRTDYIIEAERQLSNPDHYRKLDSDSTKNIVKNLITLITKEFTDKNQIEELLNRHPRTPIFYLLPKIHKENNPGRPIVSNTNGPTEPISRFIDSLLRPQVRKIPSYIKDTTDFLNKITTLGHIPSTAILCTIDVSALYTNIPHSEGIQASLDALHGLQSPTPRTIDLLMKTILNSNCFEFNGAYYEQIHGTAMGTCMAPNYANLFMGKLEKSFIETQEFKPYIWYRFIDDIFMIWLHGPDKLNNFILALNLYHNTIKFTHEKSDEKVNFLDITIRKFGNSLLTSNYHKPTDANTYLHYRSCHPAHQKKSIPYSQYLRMTRNSTTDDSKENSISKLEKNFLQRGYPKNILDTSRNQVSNLSQGQILQGTHQQQDNSSKKNNIIYVTTHNPIGPRITEILSKNLELLQEHPHTSHIKKDNLMVAYRRPKNIRDFLVRSKLTSNAPIIGNFPCLKPRCKMCKHMNTNINFHDSLQTKFYKTKGHITCDTDHIIYLINCTLCGKMYVGQTTQSLKARGYQHLNNIRNLIRKPEHNDTPVSRHFNEANHSSNQFEIKGICPAPRKIAHRLALESTWIRLLSTYAPRGINVKT